MSTLLTDSLQLTFLTPAQCLLTTQRRSTHLWSEHKRLHKFPHGLTIVGQLSKDLHHHSVTQCGVGVHVPDLCVAFTELQGHHLLVDFLRQQRHVKNEINKQRGEKNPQTSSSNLRDISRCL